MCSHGEVGRVEVGLRITARTADRDVVGVAGAVDDGDSFDVAEAAGSLAIMPFAPKPGLCDGGQITELERREGAKHEQLHVQGVEGLDSHGENAQLLDDEDGEGVEVLGFPRTRDDAGTKDIGQLEPLFGGQISVDED